MPSSQVLVLFFASDSCSACRTGPNGPASSGWWQEFFTPPTKRKASLSAPNSSTSAKPDSRFCRGRRPWRALLLFSSQRTLRLSVLCVKFFSYFLFSNFFFLFHSLFLLFDRYPQPKPTRLPNPQLRLQLPHHRLAPIPRNSLNQKLRRLRPQLVLRQFHGRQPRPKNPEPRLIIKAHQPEILRTPPPHLLRRLQQSNRHQMIRHINSVRPSRKQRMPRAKSRLQPVIALNHQILLVRQPLRLQRIMKSLPALFRIAHLQRSADQPNPFPSRASQM